MTEKNQYNKDEDKKKICKYLKSKKREMLHVLVDYLGYKFDEDKDYVIGLLNEMPDVKCSDGVYTLGEVPKSTPTRKAGMTQTVRKEQEKKEDLIKELMEITQKYTDCPYVFHKAVGYHILAATLGRFFAIPNMKVSRPNVWFVLSCIPGRGRRSTIVNYNSIVIFATLTEYYKQTENLSYNDARRKAWITTIEDGSRQGICDSIIEGVEENIRTFDLCSGEFGQILKQITGDSHYSSGVDTLLSRLYYGEHYKESLSQRGGKSSRYIPSGLYVTMLASMQEPKYYLSPTASRQGLLRRMRIIYLKSEDFSMDDWKSPWEEQYSNYKKELREFGINRLAPKMIEHKKFLDKLRDGYDPGYERENTFLSVDLCTNVREEITNMARKIDEDIINDPSDYNIYQQTRWEHLTKYTILNAISKGNVIGEYMLLAEDSHYKEAKEFDNIINKHTEEMMDEIDVTYLQNQTEKLNDRVYFKIVKAGPEGIKHSVLLNAFPYLNAKDLQEIVVSLIHRERVVSKQYTSGGQQGVKYCDSRYA